MYDRAAHLGFIQGVINRMGNNSFQCKTWAMMLFSAVAVVIFRAENSCEVRYIAPFVGFMLLVFWILDAWYLQMGKRFRQLYDDIRKEPIDEIADPYRMNFSTYPEQCILCLMFSRSVWPVYLLPVMASVAIWLTVR